MKRNNKTSLLRDLAEIAVFFAVCALVIWLFLAAVRAVVGYFRDGGRASLESDTVNDEDGVGRVTTAYDVVSPYRGSTVAEEVKTALWIYTEGDGMPPEWYRPDEPMAAEWFAEDANVPVKDIGCPDYNVESTLWGWDGHMMTGAELDLFARVFYLEFYGASVPCCEAGCDAMLNLWASGIYGLTLFETLSYCDPQYGYTYEVYPWVWTSKFDAEGLEWCRKFCLERFIEGPYHETMYFQLYGFHDTSWTIPLFECDGVYFSKGK